jgi:ectoine hydroxylase-related dioxygenase (phytanoyl-CoA dioxygenase family)
LRFDPECPMELIDGAMEDLEDLYLYGNEEKIEDGVVYAGGASPRIREAWRLSENVKAIALLPKVLAVLEGLYGREARPFQTLNFPIPTQQAPHSDAIHFNSDPPGNMCGVWIAFEDIDMDNGPLVYYPGSHRLPFTRYEDVGFDADRDEFPTYPEFIHARNKHYEAFVASKISEYELQPQYGTIKKGEGIIWSANLLHGGTPRRDENRTRHSQVTHYLFESTRFFTEMQTENGERKWKDPQWVS